MIARTPGQGSYARPERELRWLLGGRPAGLRDPVEILDRYYLGSTLRLRRMRRDDATVYKLGQKVRPDPARPSLVHLTNLYLREPEYEMLATLDGAVLSKTRWRWRVGVVDSAQTEFAVDEFGGLLRGLVLAELELSSDVATATAAAAEVGATPPSPHPAPPPPSPPAADVVADVTEDDRFSGGRLAALGPAEAAAFLEEVGATASSGGSG